MSFRPKAVLLPFFLLLAAVAGAQSGADLLKEPANKAKLDALSAIMQFPDEGWKFHVGELPNGEDPALDDSSWQPVKNGFNWNTGTAWFRRRIEVPKTLNGYDLTGTTLHFQFRVDSEDFTIQIIYFNGTRVAMGEDLEPIVLLKNAKPGDSILIAVKAITPAVKTNFRGTTVRVEAAASRPDPSVLRDELLSAGPLADSFHAEVAPIARALQAVDANALQKEDQAGFDASLRAAQSALQPLNATFKQRSIRITGNSHIDMAWLWPWSETVTVARDTFRTSLQLMNEYPEYTFTQSTAQMSAWMEEKYPELFEQIKKRVAEGRWEIVGGMWVEPDLNMPDGESLVRQLLIGKRYFKERFGKDVRIGWNPDSFGYNWQLPQIYKKSGVDFFVTQKLEWNDTNKPKVHLFWWQSPDGSKVLTYLPHDYANDINPVRMAGDLAKYSRETPALTETMHLYGVGDHGGGPTRAMINEGKKWTDPKLVYPRAYFATAQGFFDDLEKRAPSMDLTTINSELYFEYHRGVFTSQAETKKANRESEELVINAEKFAALASLFGREYPAQRLQDTWKKVLFNQFHDIAAGSGIAAIYKDAARDYQAVRDFTEQDLAESFDAIAAAVNTKGKGIPLIVFNPLAWERDDVVSMDLRLPSTMMQNLVLTDATGARLHFMLTRGDRAPGGDRIWSETQPGSGPLEYYNYHLQFLAKGVPSVGYKTFFLTARPQPDKNPPSGLAVNGTDIENEFLHVKIDSQTGCITSLVEKKTNKETIAPGGCGNLLQAFKDRSKDWDAWNIDADFEDTKWDLTKAESVEMVERGPFRALVRVIKKFQSSTFTQDIMVYEGVPRVEIATDADWHEKHILIKAAFPITVESKSATYEIPYGSIERPTTRNTPEEKAKFEVPALRWADLSDAGHGLSVLNECKYGYDGKGNVLRLSLLRAPEWPDPHADEGRHQFTYALYPHSGDWKQAETVRQGYDLNYKLLAVEAQSHGGILPAQKSFVSVEPENVVLTAVKKAEDGDGLVLRFYEWAGKATTVKLTLPSGVVSATETNLMELPGKPLAISNGTVSLATGPYEIKTLRVEFAPKQQTASKEKK